jgi:uracil-DNA glycosylase
MAMFNFFDGVVDYDDSWDTFFTRSDIKKYLLEIENKIGEKFTPQLPSDIFKVFQMNLKECRIVIFGQDPYPQENVATGRAFEVGGIKTWTDPNGKKYSSWRNILKLLHKNQCHLQKVANIKHVKKSIKDGSFKIKSPDELFKHWENQGVLLLNTALTCEVGNTEKSNSHSKHWKPFTDEVVKFINLNATEDVIWFLWGANAKKLCSSISNEVKYCSKHPRLNSDSSGTFYHENHFNKVDKMNIDWY